MRSWTPSLVMSAFVLAITTLVLSPTSSVLSQTSVPQLGDANVQIVSTLLPSGIQQILVVDTRQQCMAIYHVEPVQGKIQLKSVRRFVWDLQMEQFNAQTPLPSELREVQPHSQ